MLIYLIMLSIQITIFFSFHSLSIVHEDLVILLINNLTNTMKKSTHKNECFLSPAILIPSPFTAKYFQRMGLTTVFGNSIGDDTPSAQFTCSSCLASRASPPISGTTIRKEKSTHLHECFY